MNNAATQQTHRMTPTERREHIRSTAGFISEDGIVACGGCVDDQRFAIQGDITRSIRFADDNWTPFNPGEGDDFCSCCDKDITRRWRGI